MPAGLRSRKDAEIRPRISTKAPKSSKINVKSFEKRKDFGRKGGEEEETNKTRGGRRLRLDDVVLDRKLYDGEAGGKRRRNDDDKKIVVSRSKPPKWKMGCRNDKDFDEDDCDEETMRRGEERGQKRRYGDNKIVSRSKPPKWKMGRGNGKDVDEDDCDEETMRRGEERGNKRRGDNNKIISKSKPPKWKMGRRNLDEDDYDEETISGRKERKKLDPRGKKGNVLKCMESEEQVDETAEKKQFRFQTRVLEKTGKKIRGHKKVLDEKSEATEALPKSKKRIIKIDPYDISNKRLDDGIPSSEKVVEAEVEISKNAQFRAIQPSPSILSFVEDNLLGRRRMIELQNAGYNVKLSAPLDNIPFSNSSERERIEENVFRNKLEFFAAAKISSSFPPPIIPEIAFAGRSNVGKSSLLNALTRQWGVVRTSDKPGYTQTINFFRLASKLCLVDLPGYGFAYAKEEVKDAWEELVKEYVSTRVGLKRVCLLIDTKWGMKPRDHELIDLMERSQTPYQIVLTKTDAVFPIDVARRAMQVQEILKAHNAIVKPVTMVSSKTGAGVRNLRTVLAKIARFAKP